MTVEERFWEKVEKTDGCWNWTGAQSRARVRYGMFNEYPKVVKAHRFSYRLHFGAFDESLCVLHRCDNPLCVRPDHLFLGTYLENNADCARKLRNGKARLNPARVREIRALHAAGGTYRGIARDTGLNRKTVRDAVTGFRWNHVP
jgi:hypothetical protein